MPGGGRLIDTGNSSASSEARVLWLTAAFRFGALAVAFVVGATGPEIGWNPHAVRAGVLLLVAGAVLLGTMGSMTRGWALLDLVGLVLVGLAVFVPPQMAGDEAALALGGVVVGTIGAIWLLVWPLRALGAIALARALAVVILLVSCGSFWVVPEDWSPVPQLVIDANPVARLHLVAPPGDWTLAPPVYERVAGRYHQAVGPLASLAIPASAVGAMALLGGVLTILRGRRRAARVQAPVSG